MNLKIRINHPACSQVMGSSVWPNYHFGHTGTVRQEVNEILEIETKRQGTGVRVTIKMDSIEIVIAIP